MEIDCSVVIPVYNSMNSLNILIDELISVLPGITRDFEILLINDGSNDQSWQIIEEICQHHHEVRAINFTRNFGQHNAILCGIRKARYGIIITMDDDLQHPPQAIKSMLTKLNDGYDVVYGTPVDETHGLFRNFSSKLVKWALRTSLHLPYAEKISAFRVFRTNLRHFFDNYHNVYVSIDVLLSWGTTKISFLEIEYRERKIGTSQYTLRKLLTHTLNMVLGFSVVPLRLASILGFIFTFFGFILLFYVVLRYLIQGGSVPGFSFLASTIAVFSGIVLFVLGIIGEYMARMYTNLIARPPYVISEEWDEENE